MSQTTEEIVTFVHEWSIDRIQEVWADADGDLDGMFNAMAIHDEFAEWIATEPGQLDTVEVLSIKSFS